MDLIERRSRRDMSPQGRKRAIGMVSRDFQTVSGVGQNYQHVSAINEFQNMNLLTDIFM